MLRGLAIWLLPIVSLSLAKAAVAKDETERFAEDSWVVVIQRDQFAQKVHCSIRSKNGNILYQPAAVGFRFAHAEDTLHAIYRIDGAAPRRWQDRYPSLIAAGAQIDGASLAKPTDGVVWLPVDEVAPARVVSIRLHDGGRVRSFALKGLAGMLTASRRLGCSTNASFAN